mgnify:FL=1
MYAFAAGEDYTEASFNDYQTARDAAKGLAGNADAAQEDVDNAADALGKAAKALAPIEKQPTENSKIAGRVCKCK